MDLSPHIKNLITAYTAMPPTPRRERIIDLLQQAYLSATSDGLESTLSQKSTQSASSRQINATGQLHGSKFRVHGGHNVPVGGSWVVESYRDDVLTLTKGE